MDSFSIAHYAPDGELLVKGDMTIHQLSPRWLDVCRELLDSHGSIFSRSMGGTLERFSIECAGPICHFNVSSTTLYSAALLMSPADDNHQHLVHRFAAQLSLTTSFTAPDRFPALLVLNTFAPGIADTDREALFQLAYHFAGAYFIWSGT